MPRTFKGKGHFQSKKLLSRIFKRGGENYIRVPWRFYPNDLKSVLRSSVPHIVMEVGLRTDNFTQQQTVQVNLIGKTSTVLVLTSESKKTRIFLNKQTKSWLKVRTNALLHRK